jgi:hypothetical protein
MSCRRTMAWLTCVSQHSKWRAHANVLSVNFATTESSSPWTLFHFSVAVKEAMTTFSFAVEQVGTITARLHLKSIRCQATPPSPTMDTLKPLQLHWMSTLRCNSSRRNQSQFSDTENILLDFNSEFWRASQQPVGDFSARAAISLSSESAAAFSSLSSSLLSHSNR